MQVFTVYSEPICGANVGRVGQVRPGGRSAVVERTPGGMLGCTDGYGAAGLFARQPPSHEATADKLSVWGGKACWLCWRSGPDRTAVVIW